MSFIGDMFNSSKGAGFQGQGANVVAPVYGTQAQDAGNASNNALVQQQALLSAIQAQGGLQNQSSVYGQQQDLANQLQTASNGGGPNPALAQLAQTTGANTANQAALMAGQRGAGSNTGLIARQAAQQGAANQQNAVGQAASLAAQQQIAARGQLQQQQGMLGNLATQQAGQQIGQTNAQTAAQQQQQQMLLNQINAQNSANVGMQSNMNNVNASIAQGNQQSQNQLFSNLTGAGGQGLMMLASGGQVPKLGGHSPISGPNNPKLHEAYKSYADGGSVTSSSQPSSKVGMILKGFMPQQQSSPSLGAGLINAIGKGANALFGPSASNPTTEAVMPNFATGGAIHGESYARSMTPVPGKASVKGDSLQNDTVDAKLSPGEIIIPRTVAQAKDAPEKAKAFVAAIMAKKGKK